MKKILKFLLIIFLIPVVIVVGAIAYLKFADLNPYKPKVEQLLEKYANLDVQIAGDLDVGISLKPSLEINNVSVAKTEDGEKIAQIGNALVQISILPLFHKEIMIDVVKMNDVSVYTDQKEAIRINAAELTMDDYQSPILISFFTNVSGINIDGLAEISSLKQIQADQYDKTDLKTTINVLGFKVNFDGKLSGLQNKIEALGTYAVHYKNNDVNGNVAINLAENIPYVKADIHGEKINVAELSAINQAQNVWFINSAQAAQNNIQIPYEYFKMINADIELNLQKIIVNPRVEVNNVRGSLQILDGVLQANIKNANYQNNNITGQVNLNPAKTLPYVKININGKGFDLTKFIVSENTINNGWLIHSAQASQLLDNIDIPYEYLYLANADFNVQLNRLTLSPDMALSDIKASAVINNGNLNAYIKNITAGSGVIKGKLSLNAKNKVFSADLSGDNIVLQDLYTPYADPNNQQMYIKSGGKANFVININTSGMNTDQYLSNMNGQLIAFTDKSVLKIKSFERLQGNIIMQILNTLKISDMTKKEMNLGCAVIRSDIKNGVATFPKGIAIDATDFYLVANGTLNLQNDKLNFDLQPFSGKLDSTNISSILGSLLKIKGTVNNPKININQTSAAKNVVGFLASGGAYNVGDMLLSSDSAPCRTALEGTQFSDYFKADNSIKGNVSRGYDNVKDGINSVGKNLKSAGKELKNQVKDMGKQLKGLFGK